MAVPTAGSRHDKFKRSNVSDLIVLLCLYIKQMALSDWIASVVFPDMRPLKQVAILDSRLAQTLGARLGAKHSANLYAATFADSNQLTLMWRWVHPSSYSIGVDRKIAGMVLGLKRPPNIVLVCNDSVKHLTVESFDKHGFVVTEEMLEPSYFSAALDTAAQNVFPHIPADQRHRILFGETMPASLNAWLSCPEARPIILSSPPVQRLIHSFPPAMLRMADGRPYAPAHWVTYSSIDQLLHLSNDTAFTAITRNAPFLIVRECAERLCQTNIIDACNLRDRMAAFIQRYDKSIVIMVDPTRQSDMICEKREHDLGCYWATHADLVRAHQSLTTVAASASQCAPQRPKLSSTSEQKHFDYMVAQLARPASGAERVYAECAMRDTMNRSARLGHHELKVLHTSAQFSPSGLTYSTRV
jgi:hypothetical protein